MLIKNGLVFLNKHFERADIAFTDVITGIFKADRVRKANNAETPEKDSFPSCRSYTSENDIIDAEGAYIVPGFIDIHTHGAAGEDFSDGKTVSIKKLSGFYASQGVTSFLATTATLSENEYLEAAEKIRETEIYNGAKCLGLHLEGPFLSHEKKGSQNPVNLRNPDIRLFEKINKASGNKVKIITIAPELPNATEFIKEISKVCTVSLGHTTADYATAMKAFAAGASHLTHLFNAMPPMLHRTPGIIAAAADSGASVEIICDGIHIHPAAIRMAYRVFGDKLNLISDSLRCAGMPNGSYMFAGQQINLKDGKATLSDGTIAGSAISLHTAVKNFVKFGMPLENAVYAASTAPADAINAKNIGRIAVGCSADILIFDKDLNITKVFINGKPV